MGRALRISVLLLGTCLVMSANASPAVAQDKAADTARAEKRFAEGKAALAANKVAEACAAFAESRQIDPQLGTLLNLALCNERLGKTASAWAEFNEVVGLATRAGQTKRADVAKKHAKALERSLARARIDVTAAPADVTVLIDGEPVAAEALRSTAIPVDPGQHLLVARAAGRQDRTIAFVAPNGPAETAVVVPDLEFEPVAQQKPAAPQQAAPLATADATNNRTVGFVAGGIGAGALLISLVAGGVALGKKGSAADGCPEFRCTTSAGFDANESARSWATVSTVSFVAGAALVAVGAVFIFVLPQRKPAITALPAAGGLRFTF